MAKRSETGPKPAAAAQPPGKVRVSGTHGPLDKRNKATFGAARLRDLLNVTADVSTEQLCDEAATLIEQFQETRSSAGK